MSTRTLAESLRADADTKRRTVELMKRRGLTERQALELQYLEARNVPVEVPTERELVQAVVDTKWQRLRKSGMPERDIPAAIAADLGVKW